MPLFTVRQVDGGIEADVERPRTDLRGRTRPPQDVRRTQRPRNRRQREPAAGRHEENPRRRQPVDPLQPGGCRRSVSGPAPPATGCARRASWWGGSGDVIQAPVVSADDLHQLVGTSQPVTMRMVGSGGGRCGRHGGGVQPPTRGPRVFYAGVGSRQGLAAAALLVIVPLFAVVYGSLTTSVLKRFHLE